MPLPQIAEILSHHEMCSIEGMSLQHGMNFRQDVSVFLMSRRPGAPYADSFEKDRSQLIYEGHDEPRRKGGPDPKGVDQPLHSSSRNKKFFDAAIESRAGVRRRLYVRVYEKLRRGIWVYNGTFSLEDAWIEEVKQRNVVKFGLSLLGAQVIPDAKAIAESLLQTRVIPSSIKQQVYKRDNGKCVLCGSKTNLHFDHELAYVHVGTSLHTANIRLLCATHNLRKGSRVE